LLSGRNGSRSTVRLIGVRFHSPAALDLESRGQNLGQASAKFLAVEAEKELLRQMGEKWM
jgi:hypothetical protein